MGWRTVWTSGRKKDEVNDWEFLFSVAFHIIYYIAFHFPKTFSYLVSISLRSSLVSFPSLHPIAFSVLFSFSVRDRSREMKDRTGGYMK